MAKKRKPDFPKVRVSQANLVARAFGLSSGTAFHTICAKILKADGDDRDAGTLSQRERHALILRRFYKIEARSGSSPEIARLVTSTNVKRKTNGRTIRAERAPRQPRIDPNSRAFLESFEWRRIRMEVLKKYGAQCMCCGATRADGVKMNVDHIKPRRKFPELALSLDNLQVLCEPCNHGKGSWDQTDWRPKAAGA